MKNNQKLIFKIISVFAAIVLWMIVTYTEDNLIDISINAIEIQYKGEQALLSKGLMVTNKSETPKASVKIRGTRGDLIAVMDSVRASVDLSSIESSGTYDLTPTFDIPSSAVYVSKRNTLSVPVTVSKITEKTVEVVAVQENEDKNKAYVVELKPSVKQMNIRGDINDLTKISKAVLYMDVSSLMEEGAVKIVPVYETADREKVPLKNEIFTDFSGIEVKYNIYERKSLDIVVNIPSELKERNNISLVNQSIKKIDVGIVNEKGNDVGYLTVDFKNIGQISPEINKYKLNLLIPDGVYLPEDKRQIEVELEVLPETLNE